MVTIGTAQAAYASGDYDLALSHLNHLMGDGVTVPVASLLGETLVKVGMDAEAAEFFEFAAGLGGDLAFNHYRRAAILYFEASSDDKALACAMAAEERLAGDHEIIFLLVTLLRRAGQTALVNRFKAGLISSDRAKHLMLAIEVIGFDRSSADSLALLIQLNRLYPDHADFRVLLAVLAREFCDYDTLDRLEAEVPVSTWAERPDLLAVETPLDSIYWCGDEAINRLARNAPSVQAAAPEMIVRRRSMPHVWAEKIRIGYLSYDFFSEHATMRLLQDVLLRHDRSQFDITLFCHAPEHFAVADDVARRRWGEVVRVEHLSDVEAAAEIRRRGIDILVDLKGHTAYSRATILNHAAAPVQASWLGFPGSVSMIDSDYVIGDRFVTPDVSKPFYHEKFVRLPDSYQPNDPVVRVLPAAASRAQLGLPEDRFVFGSFNTPRKLTPKTIALWARILVRVPESVLWMLYDSDEMIVHVRRRFAALGVDPGRILFALPVAHDAHIARLQAADLALDTFPCNGHTTTSDQLWGGLPVVTAKGSNFASRVSESLLNAIGLSELVAETHEEFIALACSLAQAPQRLATLRERLVANRLQAPLFDSERFCRRLEQAYAMMASRAKAGLRPDHLDVAALPARTVPFRQQT